MCAGSKMFVGVQNGMGFIDLGHRDRVYVAEEKVGDRLVWCLKADEDVVAVAPDQEAAKKLLEQLMAYVGGCPFGDGVSRWAWTRGSDAWEHNPAIQQRQRMAQQQQPPAPAPPRPDPVAQIEKQIEVLQRERLRLQQNGSGPAAQGAASMPPFEK